MRPSLCLENREFDSALSLVVLLSGIVPFQVVFHQQGNGYKVGEGGYSKILNHFPARLNPLGVD